MQLPSEQSNRCEDNVLTSIRLLALSHRYLSPSLQALPFPCYTKGIIPVSAPHLSPRLFSLRSFALLLGLAPILLLNILIAPSLYWMRYV